MYIPGAWGDQKGVSDSLGTGVSDSYELPRRCWELDPHPLQEFPVLSTTDPALQSLLS